jgi:hypothetical protein
LARSGITLQQIKTTLKTQAAYEEFLFRRGIKTSGKLRFFYGSFRELAGKMGTLNFANYFLLLVKSTIFVVVNE